MGEAAKDEKEGVSVRESGKKDSIVFSPFSVSKQKWEKGIWDEWLGRNLIEWEKGKM